MLADLLHQVPSAYGDVHGDGNGRLPKAGVKLRPHNLTVFGQKAWAYIDEMADEDKPDAIAVVETHLMGVQLNRARRRATSLGWHLFATRVAATHHGLGDVQSSERAFANHGGEGTLVQPHVEATGYQQDADTVGFRSIVLP